MYENIRYVNSKGASVNLGAYPYFVNANGLHDYEWSYDSDNGKITQIKRGISRKTLPIRVACKTEEEGRTLKNKFYEVMDYDMLTGTPGKLYVGDYFLNCYISISKKSDYNWRHSYMAAELTVLSSDGVWNKLDSRMFDGNKVEAASTIAEIDNEGMTNNVAWFDIPFDFMLQISGSKYTNPSIIDSDFIMRIWGACSNPVIYINNHEYGVNINLSEGEYLEINSKDKTIVKFYSGGEKLNAYNARNKESDIFKKLPTGALDIQWNGNYKFELVSCLERSEPEWT